MWVWGTSFAGLFSWNENIVIINVIVNLLPESDVVCVVVAAVLGHGKQTHWAPSDRTHNTNVQFVSSDFKSGFRTPVADDDVDDLMCLAVVYSSANWTKVAADGPMPLLDMLATSVDAPHNVIILQLCEQPLWQFQTPFLLTNSTLGDLVSKQFWGETNFVPRLACSNNNTDYNNNRNNSNMRHMFVVNKYRV